MSKLVTMMIGLQGSGKSTGAKIVEKGGATLLSNDLLGTSYRTLLTKFQGALLTSDHIILDNTNITREIRKPFIDAAKAHGAYLTGVFYDTKVHQCQINVLNRMYRETGKIELDHEQLKTSRHPHVFPASVLFSFAKQLEAPEYDEGFDNIQMTFCPQKTKPDESYVNKAVFLDYDGTLRKTKSGEGYPRHPDDIEILPHRKENLQKFVERGYKLIGVSNQSGIATGKLTASAALECFKKTNELLGMDIHFEYCPHNPIHSCYCRKPQTGLGIKFMHEYKLDLDQCIMVGDYTTDKTFAKRLGMTYFDQKDFFIC